VLIWTISTGVSLSIPQSLVVGLLILLAVLGLAWQVRCLAVALRARDRWLPWLAGDRQGSGTDSCGGPRV